MGDGRYRLDALRFDTGACWLNLVATVGNAYGAIPVERLSCPDHLADWFAEHGLTPAKPVTGADVEHARELREVLRALGLAAAAGRRLPAAAVRALGTALAADEPLRVRSIDAGLGIAPPSDARRALARVARYAAQDLAGPAATQLRQCADADCGMLFLDPGGRRRWCSASVCGVKHRVRSHRARRDC